MSGGWAGGGWGLGVIETPMHTMGTMYRILWIRICLDTIDNI